MKSRFWTAKADFGLLPILVHSFLYVDISVLDVDNMLCHFSISSTVRFSVNDALSLSQMVLREDPGV